MLRCDYGDGPWNLKLSAESESMAAGVDREQEAALWVRALWDRKGQVGVTGEQHERCGQSRMLRSQDFRYNAVPRVTRSKQ